MASTCPNGFIPGRPDIEGLGTRIATYAQILLAILTIAISPDTNAFNSWWTILVTSLGLILGAVAQKDAVTFFHAVIVTWLAFPVFAMSWIFVFMHWHTDSMPANVLLVTHIHGFVFLGYGIWVWSEAATFGACPGLNKQMKFAIFGRIFNPLGWIRTFALFYYGFWSVSFLVASAAALIRLIPLLRCRTAGRIDRLLASNIERVALLMVFIPSRALTLVLVTLHNLFVLALSIWSVELLLVHNVTGASRTADDDWTFGQISALILLVGPIFTFIKLLKREILEEACIRSPGVIAMPNGENALSRTQTKMLDENDEKLSYIPSIARNVLKKGKKARRLQIIPREEVA